MNPLAKRIMEEPCLATAQRTVCELTNAQLQGAIDEALAVMEMGIMKGKDLENLKKGASLLAQVLHRRNPVCA